MYRNKLVKKRIDLLLLSPQLAVEELGKASTTTTSKHGTGVARYAVFGFANKCYGVQKKQFLFF
jgi:hypothetical protein